MISIFFSLHYQATTSPLRDIQHKILQLLGSLGGKTNISLLESSSEELAEMAVAWDTQKKLSFAVPFMDMKPTIYLGEVFFTD